MRRSNAPLFASFAFACMAACGNVDTTTHDAADASTTPVDIGAPVDANVVETTSEDVASDSGTTNMDTGVSMDSGVADAPLDVRDVTADAGEPGDATATDTTTPPDAGPYGTCAVSGAPGECISVAECATKPNHSAFAGHCPGPADIQCCIVTPSTANNPPTPTGYRLMMQSEVTPAMTTWAVMILNDPTTYPMFSTTMMTFGTQPVLARVEWHPPDFLNGAIHRGVTLYVPL